MRQLTVAIDVDEVCADLLGEWLRRYNRDCRDNLTVDDVTRWDMSQVCRKMPHRMGDKFHSRADGKEIGYGWSIYRYLSDKDLYDHVLPIPRARDAVYAIAAAGHRIVFVSACVLGTETEKLFWLQRWGFLPQDDVARKSFISAQDKSLIRADVLIDDRLENVESFPGDALLVTRRYNAKLTTTRVRINGLHEAPEVVNWLAGAQVQQRCA